MNFWVYFVLAAIARGVFWLAGPVPGYIVGGLILAGVAAYWVWRAVRWIRERRERDELAKRQA